MNATTVTLIEPKRLRTPDILYELIRAPKGPEHILVIAGSTWLKSSQRDALRKHIRVRLLSLDLPYRLSFYIPKPLGTTIVCSWTANPDFETQRKWFDEQAKAGNYPDVLLYTHKNAKGEE